MKLEVGKFYRTRDGRKVGPMRLLDTGLFYGDGLCDPMVRWNKSGSSVYMFDSLHLIAEWIEEPHMVLANGSTIVLTGSVDDAPLRSFTNHEFDVYPMGVQDIEPVTVGDRASTTPSPVRTVTRKEIVPGVYGAVEVVSSGQRYVSVRLDNGLEGMVPTVLNRGEISCLIETLTAIKEAME